MVRAKKFVLRNLFVGLPTANNFELIEEELPALKSGEFLCEAVFLSVDPYMRVYVNEKSIGNTMVGTQVAKIIASNNSDYPVGKYCLGPFGWRTHTISDGTSSGTYLVEQVDKHPLSLYLGVFGMPGITALFGLLDVCDPKVGKVVIVSGAAGAVGSLVGQIAKIKGCSVIGIAGSQEKGEWLKSIGFDHFINYKTDNIKEALAEYAPNGIDYYFDNIGGEISSQIIYKMNVNGKVAVCGSISSYNEEELPKVTTFHLPIISKQLTIQGVYAGAYLGRWQDGIKQNIEFVKSGKLKYKEHVTEGFENMTTAFCGLFKGENIGKAVIKV